jgi:hypothetical protein
LQQFMLRPTMDSLLGDDVGARLVRPDLRNRRGRGPRSIPKCGPYGTNRRLWLATTTSIRIRLRLRSCWSDCRRCVRPSGRSRPSALSTRGNLLIELLALRHQLGVLARSDRRFRPSDRLLWVCLGRFWPRSREALGLVQAATIARWHREGFRGCWRRCSPRGPERPRADLQVRRLIGRMATENCLWGAPRIHGELLKLAIIVSERRVSARPTDETVADLASVPHEPHRQPGVRLDGDLVVRDDR